MIKFYVNAFALIYQMLRTLILMNTSDRDKERISRSLDEAYEEILSIELGDK